MQFTVGSNNEPTNCKLPNVKLTTDMASFKSELSLNGKTYHVILCEYFFSQPVNAAGKPTGRVRGGKINLTLTGTTDDLLANWAADSLKKMNGKITFYKIDQDARFKEISFSNCYCVGYKEVFAPSHSIDSYLLEISLSAGKISIGNITHDNKWA